MLPAPVQFVAVELLRDGHVVRSTNTDHEGRFVFAADVPRGDYDLRLTGEYIGSAKVVWNGRARDGLVIRAQRR